MLIPEILHVRPVENNFPPGGSLENILAAFRHKTSPAEDNRGETVNLEKFPDHIDNNDPLPATASTGQDLRHPDGVGKPGPMNHLQDGIPALDVPRDQDQFEVRHLFKQSPVNVQNDSFFSFVCASGNQDSLTRLDSEAIGNLPFQFRESPGREAVVFCVPEDLNS